jgi:cysteinyl-tRNA synthetase
VQHRLPADHFAKMGWILSVKNAAMSARSFRVFSLQKAFAHPQLSWYARVHNDQAIKFLTTDKRDENVYFRGTFDQSKDHTRDNRFEGAEKGSSLDVGHDYKRDTSRNNPDVDLEKVHALLASRLQAKKMRQFDEADNICDELLRVHGVTVWDRDKTWRSGCSETGSELERAGGPVNYGPLGHDYLPSPDAGPAKATMSEEKINALLAERLQCKLSRRFADADRIRDLLESKGVYVHEFRKEWRADGVKFDDNMSQGRRMYQSRPYSESHHSDSAALTVEEIKTIENLIARRSLAKQSQNYRLADGIQDELRKDFNVHLNDFDNEWSAGGYFGPNRGHFREGRESHTRFRKSKTKRRS